jgi:predicted type IV restriction endonuclease
MTLDEGKVAFDELITQWEPVLKTIDNEADTRFKLIDQILSNVLGWHRLADFSLEKYGESGYADYVLAADGRDRMVVEAKRASSVLVGTRAKSTQYLAVELHSELTHLAI